MTHVITLNAGSATVKFALFAAASAGTLLRAGGVAEMLAEGGRLRVKAVGAPPGAVAVWQGGAGFHAEAIARALRWYAGTHPGLRIGAAGHRVVHGGQHYAAPLLVDAAVLEALAALVPLAPLHQPHNLAGIRAVAAAFPEIPQVACFDTAFHRGHAFVNDAFALPRALYAEGIRRYGFHGLSYEYIAGQLRALAPARAAGRVVVAHLGNGASMCALRDGRSVASSMGFTALDGLPMGTRCGQLDPGVLLYLLQHKGMTPGALADLLYQDSGLKGLSGLSGDMRELEAAGTAEAAEAIAYFIARLRQELGGLVALLDGLDALVFCGGIGEHAWRVPEAALAGLGWLGIELDAAANRAQAPVISTPRSAVEVRVIPTDEEAMIARHTLAVLQRA